MRFACWTGLVLLGLAAACAASAPRTEEAPLFVFRSSAWVDLHHFLRAEARRQARVDRMTMPISELSDEERERWADALAAYRDVARRDLLFDEELVRVNSALAGAGEVETLPAGLLAPELETALNGAAPLHRAHVWPAARARNGAWIAETEPIVRRHAAALARELSAAYQVPWPRLPILVQPCAETGPYLAYTTAVAPPGFAGLVTIAPTAGNRGPVAFECIAHEASHVVDAALVARIDVESARQGVEPPPDLWHALLTHTSGIVAERLLGAAGTYRDDLERDFPAYAAALQRHWRPYLEHAAPFELALRELVHDATRAIAVRDAARGFRPTRE